MSYQIQTEDQHIYRKDQLLMYLYDCLHANEKPIISLCPEGPCAEALGLYDLLDNFCYHNNYDPTNITIQTANMMECHDQYLIERSPLFWYEIPAIQKWSKNNQIDVGTEPEKHFGNFIGRSRWPRLWLAAWLYHNHKNKTLQTFHSSLRCNYRTDETDGVHDWIGLEDLARNDCDMIPEVVEFLNQCPIIIEEDLKKVKNTKIIMDQPSHYPLQHPANLLIIKYYQHIFVDIVIEPNMTGNCFLSTEKIWRCILARRPFIVMSNVNHLQNLKKLGFRTWKAWWNEGYDSAGCQYRIKEIQILINEISTWPVKKLHDTLKEMEEDLDHNFNLLQNLSYTDFQTAFQL